MTEEGYHGSFQVSIEKRSRTRDFFILDIKGSIAESMGKRVHKPNHPRAFQRRRSQLRARGKEE
jgi:hypothetical protein